MKRLVTLVVVGFISAGLVACQGTTGLSDQDKAAIRKVVEDTTKMMPVAKPDFAAYSAMYYTEDATILAANYPAVKGRAAIQAMFKTMPPMSAFKTEIVDLDGRGNLAYVRGNYTMTLAPPGAPPINDQGKYIEVWKKGADGSWKVSYDSWTSDLPVPELMLPTGVPAAGASAEVKKLGDLVGRWQINGTFQVDPKTPAGPVALTLDCRWFASGTELICTYGGTLLGQPYQSVDVYSYNPKTKTYSDNSVASLGGVDVSKVTIEPGTWVHLSDTTMDGKPAKSRMSLTSMTPAGGSWKSEASVAGGPWATAGEGKYTKAK